MGKEQNKVFCIICGLETNHEIIHDISERKDNDYMSQFNHYQIIKCRGCDSISYKTESSNTEDMYYDEEGNGQLYVFTEIYPRRGDELIKKQSFYKVSKEVKAIYNETIEAFNNKLYILCTAGIRAIIEAICIDKKIEGGMVKNSKTNIDKYRKNLEGKINGLSEERFLTPTYASFFHELRGLGNDAVHQLEIPSKDELKISIEIIEKTLFNIYEVEERKEDFESYSAMRKRRAIKSL